MLERATACLKPGVARGSLKGAPKAPRSQRLLHSSFWSHGASNLDISAFPILGSAGQQLWTAINNKTSITNASRQDVWPQKELDCTGGGSDRLFLDFLYPQHLFAWFEQPNARQRQRSDRRQLKRGVERNGSAGRGYSSRPKSSLAANFHASARRESSTNTAHEPIAAGQPSVKSDIDTEVESEFPASMLMDPIDVYDGAADFQAEKEGNGAPSKPAKDAESRHGLSGHAESKEQEIIEVYAPFGATRSDLAKISPLQRNDVNMGKRLDRAITPGTTINEESSSNRVESPQELSIHNGEDPLDSLKRTLQSSHMRTSSANSMQNHQSTAKVWELYQSLDSAQADDRVLRSEMLFWLTRQHTKLSNRLGIQLYDAIPASQRDLSIYSAALEMLLDFRQWKRAEDLHSEALRNIENGHELTKQMFKYAFEKRYWPMMAAVEERHRKAYEGTNQANQIAIFWFYVSEIPNLMASISPLGRHLIQPSITNRLSPEQRNFFCTFIREAFTQEFITIGHSKTRHDHPEHQNPMPTLQYVLRFEARYDKTAATFFQSILLGLLRPDSKFDYSTYHALISLIYKLYRRLPDVVPPEGLLMAFLQKLAIHAGKSNRLKRGNWTISLMMLTNDWEKFHGKLTIDGVTLMLKFHARAGNEKAFNHWWTYLHTEFQDYELRKQALWTSVYLSACKADLDGAQQAFAEIKRAASEHGNSPDLRCWNLLLLTHARADDLGGGLTNLRNLINDAKLKPDVFSFHPIAEMFAARGEVQKVKDLLRQYDKLTESPRQTTLYGSLVGAYVRAGDYNAAEAVLRDIAPQVKEGKIRGSLTGCFNILLKSLALRHRIKSVMRVYRWMKSQNIPMDAGSYAQLIHGLSAIGEVDEAYRILLKIMPERKIKPTAAHFSVCMNGFNKVGRYHHTMMVHSTMLRENVVPSLSTRTAYLTAKAAIEQTKKDDAGYPKSAPLKKTIADLVQDLQQGMNAPGVQTRTLGGWTSTGDADPGAYYDAVIRAHGNRHCLAAIESLFDQYMTASGRNQSGEPAPLRITTAMMEAFSRAEQYQEVENCWNVAKQLADKVTAPVQFKSLKRPTAIDEPSLLDTDSAVPSTMEQNHLDELEAIEGVHSDDAGEMNLEDQETIGGKTGEHITDGESMASHESEPRVEDELSSNDQSSRVKKNRITAEVSSNQIEQVVETQEGINTSKLQLLQPVPGRRYLLSHTIKSYLRSLRKQDRLNDEITVVITALRQGYALDSATWNVFIRHLCQNSPPLTHLAYVFSERFLIRKFPGWSWRGINSSKQGFKRELPGFSYMRRHRAPPTTLMPQYATMVWLGGALLNLRRLEADGRAHIDSRLNKYVGTLRSVREQAPKTLYAVQTMPRIIADDLQARVLHGAEHDGDGQ